MTGRPPQSYRSGRTGPRSKIKFTNCTSFDPYHEERATSREIGRPTRTHRFPECEPCALYEFPVHPEFVRPYTLADVVEALQVLPKEFLKELEAVYLLGGTSKQSHCYRLGTYGTYYCGKIFLHAHPRRDLVRRRRRLPPPHVMDEYRRCGVEYRQTGGYWLQRFRPASLRLFYLSDVLVHELGHHVDRHRLRKRSYQEGERYAEWFVREHGHLVRDRLQVVHRTIRP